MLKYINVFGISLFLTLGLFSLCFPQESVTVTTYYPSPYGSYRELTAYRMKIGTNYSGAGISVADNNLIVEGNVGIGVVNPSYRLDVAGDINTSGDVRKNGSAYINPDYVFEPGYELLPLPELKKFIADNRHLPDMPSTKQIKKEGVKIFEQNQLLLEKLEESYLYIIQLEGRIAKLETTSALKLKP